jgi:hypothetical protein
MRVIIAGGTGFIGESLSDYLISKGHNVCILSRKPKNSGSERKSYALWNPDKQEIDLEVLQKNDAIINLAGTPINGRWTEDYMREILESRINSTRTIVNALNSTTTSIKVFINASAMGYFPSDNELHHEEDAAGEHFLAKVCVAWEIEARKLNKSEIRSAIIRIGVVLDRKGGMLKSVEPIVKLGLASALGNGKQFLSVIHLQDLCRQFEFILTHQEANGIFHGVCEAPITNSDFMRVLAKTMKKPYFLPNVPPFVLKLVLGKSASFVLQSFRLGVKKWTMLGFQFDFPNTESALKAIYKN